MIQNGEKAIIYNVVSSRTRQNYAKAISLGAQYYIVKPFEIKLLIKRIRELKFYQPAPIKGNYMTREIKTQYIDIAPEDKRMKKI